MPNLSDAINVTGATTGKVVSYLQAAPTVLTAAQRSALATFVGTLQTAGTGTDGRTQSGPPWPGQAGNIWSLSLARQDGAPGNVACSVGGLVVYNDATAAVNGTTTAATQGQDVRIIGQVP